MEERQSEISGLMDTLRTLCLGRQDWIARAKKGEFKRTPAQIDRQVSILRDMIAIGKLLNEHVKLLKEHVK